MLFLSTLRGKAVVGGVIPHGVKQVLGMLKLAFPETGRSLKITVKNDEKNVLCMVY